MPSAKPKSKPKPVEIRTIADLTPDPANARRHNPRNVGTVVDALHKVGFARSIVIDEAGVILAGNATVEAAGEAGIENVKVIEADGNTIIAVQRKGLTKKQKAQLAIADNRAPEFAEWDGDALTLLAADAELDLGEMEFRDDELAKIMPPANLDFEDAPDSVNQNLSDMEAVKAARKNANEQTENKNDTEKYLVVVYPSREAKIAALKRLGLPEDERYVAADMVSIQLASVPRTVAGNGRSIKAAPADKSGAGG